MIPDLRSAQQLMQEQQERLARKAKSMPNAPHDVVVEKFYESDYEIRTLSLINNLLTSGIDKLP